MLLLLNHLNLIFFCSSTKKTRVPTATTSSTVTIQLLSITTTTTIPTTTNTITTSNYNYIIQPQPPLLLLKTRFKIYNTRLRFAACTRLAVLVLRCQHGPAAMICRGGRYGRTSGWVECGNVVVAAAAASGGTRPRAHTRTSDGRRAVKRCARPAGEWVNGTMCGRARPPWWPGGRSYELYGEPSGGGPAASERQRPIVIIGVY